MQRQSMNLLSLMVLISSVLLTTLWPQAALAQSGFTCSYTVQGGDSLIGIANRYGVKNYRDILAASGLSSDVIHPGDVLNVPCPNAVPSPTPTQVSAAPVQDPQGTPVSAPPQDCPGCKPAAAPTATPNPVLEPVPTYDWSQSMPFAWQRQSKNGEVLLYVAVGQPSPAGASVAFVADVIEGGTLTYKIFKIVGPVAAIGLGAVVAAVAPSTGVQPVATPLTAAEAEALNGDTPLTEAEKAQIQAAAAEAAEKTIVQEKEKKQKKENTCNPVSGQEIYAAASQIRYQVQVDQDTTLTAISNGRYNILYNARSQNPPFPDGTLATASGLTTTGRFDLSFSCRNRVWVQVLGMSGFIRYQQPAAVPAQPTPIPPTATPVPPPPTATPAMAACKIIKVLTVFNTYKGKSVSYSSPSYTPGSTATIIDGEGKAVANLTCVNGNWQ
ncbi:LysM peptidoglycan-binding domain-containing protein [Candidatus Woesebacteria bacterium]|nr:LysM peptidoglycan-binding domain-containing protein [Candidatus Woesebacteria bacterium]